MGDNGGPHGCGPRVGQHGTRWRSNQFENVYSYFDRSLRCTKCSCMCILLMQVNCWFDYRTYNLMAYHFQATFTKLLSYSVLRSTSYSQWDEKGYRWGDGLFSSNKYLKLCRIVTNRCVRPKHLLTGLVCGVDNTCYLLHFC